MNQAAANTTAKPTANAEAAAIRTGRRGWRDCVSANPASSSAMASVMCFFTADSE